MSDEEKAKAEELNLVAIILAVILPPLGVLFKQQKFDVQFLINLVLTLLGWLPGVLHALYVILRK